MEGQIVEGIWTDGRGGKINVWKGDEGRVGRREGGWMLGDAWRWKSRWIFRFTDS